MFFKEILLEEMLNDLSESLSDLSESTLNFQLTHFPESKDDYKNVLSALLQFCSCRKVNLRHMYRTAKSSFYCDTNEISQVLSYIHNNINSDFLLSNIFINWQKHDLYRDSYVCIIKMSPELTKVMLPGTAESKTSKGLYLKFNVVDTRNNSCAASNEFYEELNNWSMLFFISFKFSDKPVVIR